LIKIDGATYVYYYTTSSEDVKNFKTAYTDGYNDFDADNAVADDGSVDVPLFTVSPMGRGASNLFVRINPEYSTNRSFANYARYSFEVYESTTELESILFSMNPNIIVDGVAQAMNPKIKANSDHVQVRLFEDGLSTFINTLAETATDTNGDAMSVSDLLLLDFVFGTDLKGKNKIGNIFTISDSTDDGSDLWSENIPSDIADAIVDLSDANGIKLVNGSYGEMGTSPINNPDEYEKMLLAAWGGNTDSIIYDPMIYDMDAFKVDATFDCAYPLSVKKQILNVADWRGDFMFFSDLGMEFEDVDSMINYAEGIPNSRYIAMYHNFFNVYDPYTKKEITVTMPYLLAIKMVDHIASGVIRPFAGYANKMTFPEIIDDTINFLPYDTPGINQKQMLVDANINYINYYDGVPTMDTMYTNNAEHSQLSYISQVMGVQEIIKRLRSEMPKSRFTFIDGDDLEEYLDTAKSIINEYSSYYKSLDVVYMADEKYEANKIFYATLTVQFKDFFQEEYFKIVAIN
jgi:hypothetical protein